MKKLLVQTRQQDRNTTNLEGKRQNPFKYLFSRINQALRQTPEIVKSVLDFKEDEYNEVFLTENFSLYDVALNKLFEANDDNYIKLSDDQLVSALEILYSVFNSTFRKVLENQLAEQLKDSVNRENAEALGEQRFEYFRSFLITQILRNFFTSKLKFSATIIADVNSISQKIKTYPNDLLKESLEELDIDDLNVFRDPEKVRQIYESNNNISPIDNVKISHILFFDQQRKNISIYEQVSSVSPLHHKILLMFLFMFYVMQRRNVHVMQRRNVALGIRVTINVDE